MRALALVALLLAVPAATRADGGERPLRVQLLWSHQAQFAGFYVAEARKYFQAEGVAVEIVPGGPGIFPMEELQAGRADVVVSWFTRAASVSRPDRRVTNVAQVFSGSGLQLLCRNSAGVVSPSFLEGKTIGVWGLGDELVVKEIVRRLGLPESSVTLVRQRANGVDLVEGKVACASAMSYNEYWSVLAAGVDDADLLVLSPSDFGILHIEDGLYVSTARLSSPVFQDRLVRLVRALRRGWDDAHAQPTYALHAVLHEDRTLNPDHQRSMLETVLKLVPDREAFGEFDLGRFQSAVAVSMSHGGLTTIPPDIWTHRIWRAMKDGDGKRRILGPATLHYLAEVTDSAWFRLLVLVGVGTFALSGALEGVRRRYDLYGALALAFLSCLGGGTVRDVIIGGDRLPLFYVKDATPLVLVIVVTVTAMAIFLRWPSVPDSSRFRSVKLATDIVGFAILAVAGARAAVGTGAPWLWMPLAAAVTCAGGGALRDIVVNQEPKTFRGVIYEEVAVIGALVFLAGLWVADHFESSPTPVYLSIVAAVLVTAALRVVVHRHDIRYSTFFPKQSFDPPP